MPENAINYTTASEKVTINVVMTPAQKIHQITTFIQDLVASDELNSQFGIELISELQDAKEHLSHGYTNLAIVNLKNVILQIKTDISYGVLSPKNGKTLIDGVKDVISPALTITKSAAPITYNAAEQPITYTYTVTNSGNVNLSGITVTDTILNQQISISGSNLAPGQNATGTATCTTTQSDVDNGSVVNTATVSCIFNNNSVSNTTITTVNAVQSPNQTISSIIIVYGTWQFFELLGFGGPGGVSGSKAIGPGSHPWVEDLSVDIPTDSISSFKCIDRFSRSTQDNWRWCNKCQVLFFAGHAPNYGVCPAGDNMTHLVLGTMN